MSFNKFLLLLLLFHKKYLLIVCDHGNYLLLSNNCQNSFTSFSSEIIDNRVNNNNKQYKTCSLHFDANSDNVIVKFDLVNSLCINNTVNLTLKNTESKILNPTIIVDNKNLCDLRNLSYILLNSTNGFHIDLVSDIDNTFSIINFITVTKITYANVSTSKKNKFLILKK